MSLKVCFASFSVRLTVSAVSVELVDQTNISADCYQLILSLSVCLALDFKQDQELVKRQSLGSTEHCSDCLSDCRLLFVSFLDPVVVVVSV